MIVLKKIKLITSCIEISKLAMELTIKQTSYGNLYLYIEIGSVQIWPQVQPRERVTKNQRITCGVIHQSCMFLWIVVRTNLVSCGNCFGKKILTDGIT